MHLPLFSTINSKLKDPETNERSNGKQSPRGGKAPGETDTSAALECRHPVEQVSRLFSTTDYITGEKFDVGYCHTCKLHITSPAPRYDELGRFYPSSYYGSGQRFNPIVEMLLNNLYSYRAIQIENKHEPGKVLDVGCGRGLLLDKLRRRGWEPQGTELSEEAATFARKRLGLPVTTKELKECEFPDSEFDLVILWHVLEHVRSPKAMLMEINRILKPGGILLVAVPNFSSWEARLGGPAWFHLDVPRHLNHFTTKSLRRSLKEAGLSVVSSNFFSTEYDFFSFVQSTQNKLGFRHNYLYNLLRTRSAKVIDAAGKVEKISLIQTALVLLTAIPLACISLVAAPVIASLNKGATITLYALKDREGNSQ